MQTGRYSKKDEDLIRIMHLDGASDKEIAEATGRSVFAVQTKRFKMGLIKQPKYDGILNEVRLVKNMLMIPDHTKLVIISLLKSVQTRSKMEGMEEALKMMRMKETNEAINRMQKFINLKKIA